MFLLLSVCVFCITISILSIFVIHPYLKKLNEIKEKQVKNDLYQLYASLDPEAIQQNIDNLIDRKIADYILINIKTRESQYMNAKDIDTMIKTVSADTYLYLSDMYITFIKMVYNISNDDDLIVYINNTVKMRSIPVVTDNNKLI